MSFPSISSSSELIGRSMSLFLFEGRCTEMENSKHVREFLLLHEESSYKSSCWINHLPAQFRVQQLFIGQSVQKAPVRSVSTKSLRQHRAWCFTDTPAAATHAKDLPGPPEPLRHVGGRVWHPFITGTALPPEAERHVGVHVKRFGCGWIQLYDGW